LRLPPRKGTPVRTASWPSISKIRPLPCGILYRWSGRRARCKNAPAPHSR
jgi:hypothetical protein